MNDPNRRRRRVTYRPSRVGSAMSMVVGFIFVVIGFTVVIPSAGAFGVVWTLVAVAIVGTSAYSAFGRRNIGPEIYIEDEEKPQEGRTADADGGIEQRLERLNDLHDKGLVTDEEYEKKRQEILDEL